MKTYKKNLVTLFAILLLLLVIPACDSVDAGINPGGAQDNGNARENIEKGYVPLASSFTYEGMFAEHNFFPGEESSCDKLICIKTVLSKYTPFNTENNSYVAQLIMSSNVSAENFKHSPIDLMIVLDKSGSMNGDRFERSKVAIVNIIKKLTPQDSFGLIAFDDSYSVDIKFQKIEENKDNLIRVVEDLQTAGGTNIENALKNGYSILKNHGELSNRRVILITDAKPNIGAVDDDDFVNIIKNYEDEIGITVFGVGIDFGQELVKSISETKGGNYIYLENIAEIDKRLDRDFEFLISPIANDFNIKIKTGENFKILNSYGLPNNDDNKDEILLNVKTLFLSKSKGAIAIEFRYEGSNNEMIPMDNDKIFDFDWSYTKLDDTRVTNSEAVIFSPFRTTANDYSYNLEGAVKLPLLINLVTALHQSLSAYYYDNIEEAISLLDKILVELNSTNEILKDEEIRKEISMVEELKKIMENNNQ